MTYTIPQQIEALKMVIQEKRTGEVELANILEAALKTLVAKSATAGPVYPANEHVPTAYAPLTTYKKFEAEYQAFCQRETGMDGRMDGGQGEALNKIIAYLTANCKTRTEAGALGAWKYLLMHWNEIDTPFLKRQKSLLAINKYLVELLEIVRKAGKKEDAKPVSPAVAARKKRLASEIEDARNTVKHFKSCDWYEGKEKHQQAAEAALKKLEGELNQLG